MDSDMGRDIYIKRTKGVKTINYEDWVNFRVEGSTVTYDWCSIDHRATNYREGIVDIVNDASNNSKEECIGQLVDLLDKMEEE